MLPRMSLAYENLSSSMLWGNSAPGSLFPNLARSLFLSNGSQLLIFSRSNDYNVDLQY